MSEPTAPGPVISGEGLAGSLEKRHNLGMKMTTKVKIEIALKHMPIVIEVLRSDGTVPHTNVLSEIGASVSEYVHSGQMLRVREMTPEEAHHTGFAPA